MKDGFRGTTSLGCGEVGIQIALTEHSTLFVDGELDVSAHLVEKVHRILEPNRKATAMRISRQSFYKGNRVFCG